MMLQELMKIEHLPTKAEKKAEKKVLRKRLAKKIIELILKELGLVAYSELTEIVTKKWFRKFLGRTFAFFLSSLLKTIKK